ncbi:hypothetical protein NKH92_30480, partial [Mesorhizobium sp. M0871]|uniref:hypothetical protein n=1 Tax=Mesorhizobium sp. M0871 TaxID=2957017 RepID=UPI003335CC8E
TAFSSSVRPSIKARTLISDGGNSQWQVTARLNACPWIVREPASFARFDELLRCANLLTVSPASMRWTGHQLHSRSGICGVDQWHEYRDHQLQARDGAMPTPREITEMFCARRKHFRHKPSLCLLRTLAPASAPNRKPMSLKFS